MSSPRQINMKLRIIAGSLKRRNIVLSGTAARFRPTKKIVRESVANTLGIKIKNAIVADMCAGSGAFGFEMVSRGAESAHFIDINKERCRSIASHAHQFDVERSCVISTVDIRTYLKTCSFLYDIIYYDPPYDKVELIELIPKIVKYLSKNGVMIFEYEKANKYCDIFTKNDTVNLLKSTKRFGKTELCFFTRTFDLKAQSTL